MTQNKPFQKIISILVNIALVVAAAGCGGTKVLKEPQPLEITQPLAIAKDQHISAVLYWVIVRDGPGTWAKNADWDEYFIKVANDSGEEIQITEVVVVDSLGTRIASNSIRKQLVKESEETVKRYKNSKLKVKAGMGSGTMIATGTAVAVGGTAAFVATIPAVVFSTSTAPVLGSLVLLSGGLLVGPALVVGGIVRANNNNKVEQEIERRHTILPVNVKSEEPLNMDIFFPLAPSPSQLEVTYTLVSGKETLVVDTGKALNGLHLIQEE